MFSGLIPDCMVSAKTPNIWALFDEDFGPSSTDIAHWRSGQKATGTAFTNRCSMQIKAELKTLTKPYYSSSLVEREYKVLLR